MPKIYKSLLICALFFLGIKGFAQTSVNSIGSPVSENFNGLPSTGVVGLWSQSSTVSGWYGYETDPYRKAVEIMPDSGAQASGRLYSYGRAGSTERCLGSLGSGSTDSIVFGWRLKNNTGFAVNSVTISFTGEQWRRGANVNTNKLAFYYKVASSISSIDSLEIKNLSTSGYTSFPALDFISPKTASTASILNGNDTANSRKFSQTLSVNIANGEEIMIMWFDDDEVGNDHGLGIDDISVVFSNQDKTPPSVNKITLIDKNTVTVDFSEKVTTASATDTANFHFSPALTIDSIRYDTSLKSSKIYTNFDIGRYHTLKVNGIVDMASPSNKQTAAYTSGKMIYNNYNGGKLVISEINYNDPSANDNYEFVEVSNAGVDDIELGGLKFTFGITYSFDEYTLSSGKSVAIAKLKDSCEKQFSVAFLGSFSGALDNAGEKLILSNSINEVIDSVRYDDVAPWFTEADGSGYSLQLKTPFYDVNDNDLGSSWSIDSRKEYAFQAGTKIYATPGFSLPSIVNIAEVKINDAFGVNKAIDRKVELVGTVYGINFDNSGLAFVLRDATDGIFVSSSSTFTYTVNEGDSVRVTGTIDQLDGLSAIIIDTIMTYGTSKSGIKTPKTIVTPQESNECDLVKMFNLKLAENITKWPSDDFVKLLSGTDTVMVFISAQSNVAGTNLPAALSFNLTGLGLQVSTAPKLDDGYFIAIRSNSDIDFVPVPDPEVAFTTTALTVTEKDKATVELKINNPNSNITSLTVVKIGGSANAGSDYISNLPVTVNFPAGDGSNQSITINMVNDITDEPNKTIQLAIRNVNNKAIILADSIITITIQDNDNPLYPIGTVAKVDANGVPDSNNVKVQVKGIVYGVNIRPAGLQFVIRDNTGGIGVFNPAGNFGYTVKEGDEILISGTVNHFRGLTQISFMDTLLKVSTGNTIKSPVVVTKLGENTESDLVQIKGVRWAQTKPTTWTANTNFKFTNGTDTVEVRVDGDITLAGTAVPAYDTLNITGLGGQFATSASGPFLNGYQLLPNRLEDVEKYKQPAQISVYQPLSITNLYPNPSNGSFNITSNLPVQKVQILNAIGQVVADYNGNGSTTISINTNLTFGLYYVKVISGNHSAIEKLLVK